MKRIKFILPFLFILILDFYLLPLLIMDTGSGMFMLLLVIPAICFISSIIFGIKHSFQITYPLSVGVLFIPAVFIFYNSTAWVYVFAYGIVALIGNAIGMIFYRRKK